MDRQTNPASWRQKRRHLTGCLQGLLLLSAGALSGCAGVVNPASGPMAAMASVPADGHAVAFESIDGAPPQVFDLFVQVLESESHGRNVAVVSRSAAASFHVRSYLSAQMRGERTFIAWVWDVYDADQQRVLRLSGEEEGGKTAGRDAWAMADVGLLRRIAQSGLIRLSGFVNGTAPPAPPPSGQPGPAIASLSDGPTSSGRTALGFSEQ